jgi:hypothetical protein
MLCSTTFHILIFSRTTGLNWTKLGWSSSKIVSSDHARQERQAGPVFYQSKCNFKILVKSVGKAEVAKPAVMAILDN